MLYGNNTNHIYGITTICEIKNGDDPIRHLNRDGFLLIFVMILSLSLCGTVAAHPGHGTPIEEPSDPGTGEGTDSGSSGSTSSGSSQASSYSGYTSSQGSNYYDPTSGVTQTGETGTTETQTTDEAATENENAPEEVFDTSEASDSAGGPVAMIGLMVVIGLITMSFPYKEGGVLRNLQIRLFGR